MAFLTHHRYFYSSIKNCVHFIEYLYAYVFLLSGKYKDVKNNLLGFFQTVNDQYGDIVNFQKIFGLDDAVYLYNPSDIEKVLVFKKYFFANIIK